MAYDLSTYEGRQAARDAGNWVGADSSGQIVMEPASGGGGSNTVSGSSPAPSSGGGGAQIYNTVNGPRTPEQMMRELEAAGWDHSGEIKDVYARTTGGAVTATGQTTTAPGAPAIPGAPAVPQGVNLNAATTLLNQAQQAAYQAYLTARLNLETDAQAFSQAQQAFTNKINEASLTGSYNGAPTQAALAQEAGLTGMYQGKPTLAREQMQQTTANDYLKLISGLRGPQDYGQYLKVIGSTPQGLSDLVASASGKYIPASGATTGAGTTPASLGGLVGDVTGGGGGMKYAQYMDQVSQLPRPNQISPDAWNTYTDSQKKVLLGMYESAGFNPTDVTDLYKQSLPRYAGPAGAGVIKL